MDKLKYYRISGNKTLEDLSKETSISVGYLAHLEIGSRNNPSKEVMEKIATALGKSVAEVFFTELTEEEIQELAEKGHTVEGGDKQHET